MKRALVTGLHGQDATYLIELLLGKGYEVTATTRGSEANITSPQPFAANPDFQVCLLDLTSLVDCHRVVETVQPDEIYHLAGPSHVVSCEQQPQVATDIIAMGTGRMLEATHNAAPTARFFFASSAEVFRGAIESPQNEGTTPRACNTYGAAKLIAQSTVREFRQAKRLFACSGILYNHESPLRPETFVTRKITAAAARIAQGQQTNLKLGRIDAQRDWSFAGDVVEAMWLMLQAEVPDDYVVASGTGRRVSDWLDSAFAHVGLDWKDHVEYDGRLFRDEKDAQLLVGDPSKIEAELGWRANIEFDELVRQMVDDDLSSTKKD
jgi:GDPmannose 4,6-dehydratase